MISKLESHMFMQRSSLLSVTLLSLMALSAPAAGNKQDSAYPVFDTAPAPELLAELLFPPLYRSIDGTGETVAEDAEFGMMINFGFDSTEILPESKEMLQSLGEMLGMQSVSGKSIVIEGHTDAIGEDAYNQKLSELRASAIRSYLVEHFGIAPKRLLTVGKGERQLFASDDPKASINRRASFRPARRVVLK